MLLIKATGFARCLRAELGRQEIAKLKPVLVNSKILNFGRGLGGKGINTHEAICMK